jgi:hypothetical protein
MKNYLRLSVCALQNGSAFLSFAKTNCINVLPNLTFVLAPVLQGAASLRG